MLTRIETYSIKRFKGKKNKKIENELSQLEYIENCLFDKVNNEWVLKVNYSFENEASFETRLPKYVKAILLIVQKYEKKATFNILENEEVYRKVVYLKGLDCAHCAARIETIAKRQFKHEQLIVDFATTRFIIETTDKELADDIIEEVSNVAHRVDPRIIVQDGNVAKKEYAEEEKEKKDIPFIIITALGLILFLVALILEFNIVLEQSHGTEMTAGQWFFQVYSPLGTVLFSLAFTPTAYVPYSI